MQSAAIAILRSGHLIFFNLFEIFILTRHTSFKFSCSTSLHSVQYQFVAYYIRCVCVWKRKRKNIGEQARECISPRAVCHSFCWKYSGIFIITLFNFYYHSPITLYLYSAHEFKLWIHLFYFKPWYYYVNWLEKETKWINICKNILKQLN